LESIHWHLNRMRGHCQYNPMARIHFSLHRSSWKKRA